MISIIIYYDFNSFLRFYYFYYFLSKFIEFSKDPEVKEEHKICDKKDEVKK
jgi:hypothetical protein